MKIGSGKPVPGIDAFSFPYVAFARPSRFPYTRESTHERTILSLSETLA